MTEASPNETQSPGKPAIPYDLFAKIDLRVATITKAEPHPDADRLLKIQLDDGSEGGRQVCAGIKAWYDPAALVGRQVIIVANLEPRKIRGELSEGMILAASTAPKDGGDDAAGPRDVVVLTVEKFVPAGSIVS
ncbi:MAG: methionine--tRNA ligase subunit beta [Phycisphaerales bacterium]